MLTKKMQKAINDQINAELYSSYLYLSMSAYFESINLDGFAGWMRAQVQEELVHVMKLFHFVTDRGGVVLLSGIEGPPTKWTSPLKAFQDAYKHECKVTASINKLVDLAVSGKDHAANAFLQWFVTEQVEEEASADEVVQKLKLMADAPGGLFLLDRELAQRTFTMPAPAEGDGA